MSETGIGDSTRKQVSKLAQNVTRDGLAQMVLSRQDSEPLIALLHNIEASSHLRLAKRLLEEGGAKHESDIDYIDILADLSSEHENILQELIATHITSK